MSGEDADERKANALKQSLEYIDMEKTSISNTNKNPKFLQLQSEPHFWSKNTLFIQVTG